MSRDFEFYATPHAHTRAFCRELRRHDIYLGRDLYEPCVGAGDIVDAVDEFGRWSRAAGAHHEQPFRWQRSDLDPRWAHPNVCLDATKPDTWLGREIDTVITNPPFSAAQEILEHALERARVAVIFYLRVSFHEVLKEGPRRSFLREHPPTGVLFLPRFAYRRSPTTLKWTTDSMGACWAVWVKGARRQWIAYADEQCLVEQDAETAGYRARMDQLLDGDTWSLPAAQEAVNG